MLASMCCQQHDLRIVNTEDCASLQEPEWWSEPRPPTYVHPSQKEQVSMCSGLPMVF